MDSRCCDVNPIHDTTITNSRCYRHALTIGHALACLAGNGAQRRVGGQFGGIGRVYALRCIDKVTVFVASRQRKSHVLMQVRCTSHSFTWDFLSLQQPISIKFSCSGTTFPRWFQILSYLHSKLSGSSTPVKNIRRIWPCGVMRNLIDDLIRLRCSLRRDRRFELSCIIAWVLCANKHRSTGMGNFGHGLPKSHHAQHDA
jgi:hypothetical protein